MTTKEKKPVKTEPAVKKAPVRTAKDLARKEAKEDKPVKAPAKKKVVSKKALPKIVDTASLREKVTMVQPMVAMPVIPRPPISDKISFEEMVRLSKL